MRLLLLSAVSLMSISVAHAADSDRTRGGAAVSPKTLTAIGEGRRDFLKWNCYSCHGMNGAGGMGPNIQHAESGDLQEAVLQGEEGGMPSFAKYATSKDVANLAAYLNSIGTANEPTWVDWWNAKP